MATKKKRLRPERRDWTDADVRLLKSGANKTPAREMARAMGRTEGAVRQKAFAMGISLRAKRRAA